MSAPNCFNPTDVAPPHKSYSHICSTTLIGGSRLLTFAGQIGVRPDSPNREPAPSFREQVSIALENVSKCLAAAGATTKDIVSVRQYIVNLLPMDPCRRELYEEWMGDHRPPSTIMGVVALADEKLLYEIEVMAVVHGDRALEEERNKELELAFTIVTNPSQLSAAVSCVSAYQTSLTAQSQYTSVGSIIASAINKNDNGNVKATPTVWKPATIYFGVPTGANWYSELPADVKGYLSSVASVESRLAKENGACPTENGMVGVEMAVVGGLGAVDVRDWW